MSDFQPQDKPGMYKRLDFENLGGDDYSRRERTEKGIAREITTPKLSVPYSREGTRIHEYIDRNEIKSAIAIRDSIIRLIVFVYPVVKLQKALLSYITSNTIIQHLFQVKYKSTSGAVSPETYTNG